MVYTTQELIDILEAELKANWQGQRLLISSRLRIDNPVIAKALNLDKVSKVFAYRDFRAQVHQYQKEHQVSGIVWRVCQFRGFSISIPEVHSQLTAIETDKQILVNAKPSIIDFWIKATANMKYFQLTESFQEISLTTLTNLVKQREWAEVYSGCDELYLGLCWGNPNESQYLWAKPHSGCDRLVAAEHQPSGIIK